MNGYVNHVDHVAWMAHLDNQKEYAERLGLLGGRPLDGPYDKLDSGVRIYLSWETGLEVLSPLPGYDTDLSQMLTSLLDEKGEGIFAVVFNVPGFEGVWERARQAGYEPAEPRTALGDDAPWVNKLETFAELFVGDFLGTHFVYGDLAYAPGVMTVNQS